MVYEAKNNGHRGRASRTPINFRYVQQGDDEDLSPFDFVDARLDGVCVYCGGELKEADGEFICLNCGATI